MHLLVFVSNIVVNVWCFKPIGYDMHWGHRAHASVYVVRSGFNFEYSYVLSVGPPHSMSVLWKFMLATNRRRLLSIERFFLPMSVGALVRCNHYQNNSARIFSAGF